ncbi:MAG: M23 family metallopeptidase [Bacteroidetes bacterium]|nr:M23 family metallopeptidase [Bacteroidota bacterium]
MINFRTLFLLFLIHCFRICYAQYNGLGFIYPIDREVVVTGNYGEIRPNHFHAGLDFSTDPVANLPIKSVADGYVSRIKISSGGYGRVLYVTHTNGYVTVYAHQKKYAEKIDVYVKKKQTEQKKNELELFPAPGELPVKKGELIGYSGNSGSSTGPHLHFEIREEQSEIPINPLLVYDVKDHVKPVITHLVIYNTKDSNAVVSQSMHPVTNKAGKLTVTKSNIILPQNTFAVGFAGYDMADASTSKNNIYEAKLTLDGQLIYHHQLNTISFDNGRYVNVFSEKVAGVKYQKCFTPSCYDIRIYKSLVNGGKVQLKDTLWHTIELTVADEKGNTNQVICRVKATRLEGYISNSALYNAYCYKDCSIKKDDIECEIKAGTASRSLFVAAYINKLGKACVGNKNESLLKAFSLSVKVNKPLKDKASKMVLMNEDNCLTGKYENGWFKTESKSFGAFGIAYDTVAPKIIMPVSKKKASQSPVNAVHFKVSDNLSGIADYNVFVNDVWQIAEYDAKTATVSCYFNEPLVSGIIKIEVSDKVGNKAKQEVKL